MFFPAYVKRREERRGAMRGGWGKGEGVKRRKKRRGRMRSGGKREKSVKRRGKGKVE